MFAALLGALPGFALKFFGSGIIEKLLDHKKQMAESANERERIKLEGEIKKLEDEQDRRKRIAELQALEYQHPALWWPKFGIGMAVALYVISSFVAKTLNLTADYNIVVPALDVWQQGIAGYVVAYFFLKS